MTYVLVLDGNKQGHNYGFYVKSFLHLALFWHRVVCCEHHCYVYVYMYSLTEKNNLSLAKSGQICCQQISKDYRITDCGIQPCQIVMIRSRINASRWHIC